MSVKFEDFFWMMEDDAEEILEKEVSHIWFFIVTL